MIIRLPPNGRIPDDAVKLVVHAVQACKVVAFPTDTVYGLGSTGLVKAAARRICQIKGRDAMKPLPILLPSAEAARRWVEWTPAAEALAKRFWPGALTLALKPTQEGRVLTYSEFPTVAVRVPDHPVTLKLLQESGVPWASTSANTSGSPALSDGEEVARQFQDRVDCVIDAGKVPGTESTVVDCSRPKIRVLREGAIGTRQIMAALEGVQGVETAGPVRKVLFICTGNTCRSLMAEKLLGKVSADRSLGMEARSCGTAAERFFEVPEEVYAVLGAVGIDRFDHVPQLVSREILNWADVAFAMTDEHLEEVLDRYPEFGGKAHVLGRYADVPEPNVEDPIGQSEKIYETCRTKIQTYIESALERMRT